VFAIACGLKSCSTFGAARATASNTRGQAAAPIFTAPQAQLARARASNSPPSASMRAAVQDLPAARVLAVRAPFGQLVDGRGEVHAVELGAALGEEPEHVRLGVREFAV
jgi:hypothetical protein